MKKTPLASAAEPRTALPSGSCWLDDACILDMDYFVKTITGIKSKGVRPDLIGSIVAHYASKWLPELLSDDNNNNNNSDNRNNMNSTVLNNQEDTRSMTAQWMKKRFFVETLVGILPVERDSVPCNFLLRLLRTANMVGAEAGCRAELEARAACQLEGASLKELMIPSFSHTCGTVLDVELVTRLVRMFAATVEEEEEEELTTTLSSEGRMNISKVGKVVDGYLAEVALDSNLGLLEFVSLAASLPHHARTTHDALYRAIDTFLKTHPGVSKQERKSVCRLIDSRKLSPEASFHAAHNDRLPVRVVIQVLFAEQTKLNRQVDWSGSSNDLNNMSRFSPNPRSHHHNNNNITTDQAPSTRCHSKREVNAQQSEIRKLKEDVVRLQSQCLSMQNQMGRMVEMKVKKGHVLNYYWKKLGFLAPFKTSGGAAGTAAADGGEVVMGGSLGRETPVDLKAKLVRKRTTPPRWRKSMS